MRHGSVIALSVLCSLATGAAQAHLLRLTITGRSTAFAGRSFGATGRYELLVGKAYGELDPRDPHDRGIQDLTLAPTNADGRVEYSMDVVILKPVDVTRGNHAIFYEVPNRGHFGTQRMFNVGAGAPSAQADAGDGYLERLGFTLVWGGWQADLPASPGTLRLTVPIARGRDGRPITGRVLADYEFRRPRPGTEIGWSFVGAEDGPPAVSTDNRDAILTEQVHAADAPVTIPTTDWRFADCSTTPFPGTPSTTDVCLKGGFDTNHIYQLIYTASGPEVSGIGFAATRDLVSFLHYETRDTAGTPNPVAGGNASVLGLGISQDGRFLRDFLYQGFNRDERDRRVFDGLDVHIAAARMPLNQRFVQPGYNAVQHETRLAATQDMPLSWAVIRDPLTGRVDGILRVCQQTHSCPVIFQTMSSLEWWQERMSLDTTDGAGHDVPLPSNVRVFHMSGTQHGPAREGAPAGVCQQRPNPNSYQGAMRALLPKLLAWAAHGDAPPASRYPRVSDGTLVSPDQASTGFPHIPGVTYNGLVMSPPNFDRGPGFDSPREAGVISVLPPRPEDAGRRYDVLVPKVNADGNETDGVASVTLEAPLGTYTGWNLRRAGFSEGDLCFLSGSFIPFANTRAERLRSGDPRPSLEERYHDHAGYVAAVRAGALRLEAQGWLLKQDGERAIAVAQASEVLR
ncbi:MAG TPA: alpha/beta hydrolase domain-containing protein [Steroidobacteraceae bacterium]|nr:alpha/beta hydrolase domain-containing protein [Steroidobacteraceae bacterium]